MPRHRIHANAAAKQRAYRNKHRPQQDVTLVALRDLLNDRRDGLELPVLYKMRRMINDAVEDEKAFEKWRRQQCAT
jgi:hypothetical protein